MLTQHLYFNFTLYQAYSRIGRGHLVLGLGLHSPPYFGEVLSGRTLFSERENKK